MGTNPWLELERELNAKQREAVFTDARHCLVLAGPGTGKTRTLVNRIVYMVLVGGVDPASIQPLTFTRKAARVMIDRLARYLGDRAAEIQPGTFHHFGLRLLREQAGRDGIPRDFAIADEPRQLRILQRAWNRMNFSSREPEQKELRMLLGLFGAYRVERESGILSRLQVELFTAYQELMRAEGALDFDDILDLTRTLLETDEKLLAETRARWPRILVDEFQDTDALQYRIIKQLLGSEDSSSFLVADDQQSIYAWRGADRRNLEYYREEFSPREVYLSENYRNGESILRCARALLAAGEGESERKLVSRASGVGSLRSERFESEREEADFLAADIRSARSRDRTLAWREIAVLYPKHAIGEYLETRLMAERLPVELVAGRALLEQKRIRRLIAFLRILRNGGDSEALEILLAGHLDEGGYALLRQVIRHRGDSPRIGLDSVLRAADLLREAAKRWERFSEENTGLAPAEWERASSLAYPAGVDLLGLLPVEKGLDGDDADDSEAARRARFERDGERLVQLARLTWRLEGLVARISNLRVGQGGRTLSQLVREVLMEIEDGGEGGPPGDPLEHPGLAELLARLRELLRRGGRVLLSASTRAAAEVLVAMLREGLEPWLAQNLTADPDGVPTTATIRATGDAVTLAAGGMEDLTVSGAPAPLLLFRLYQLWRAAEHRSLSDYVIFDLETTGIDVAGDEIIEIAAIRFERGKEQARFSTLVKPRGSIPPGATRIHGIDDAAVADAPPIEQALREFLEFIGDRDLVAHNGVRFDMPFVRRVARDLRLPVPRNSLFDTLALARRLFPGERVSLERLIERFGIHAEARHRALDDCRCLAVAFQEMQLLHLGELRRRAGIPALAPAALALYLAADGVPGAESAAGPRELFRRGVRRLLSGGSDWLERFVPREGRAELESDLLELSGLAGESPELFTGLRSEEERFLALVPRFDELFLGDSLASFLDFLALYHGADLSQNLDAVQMMTIHSAKGLEFRRVYILGLEENVLPGYYALRGGDEAIAEERRLLYVAMTRAAESLTLSSVESRGGFRQEPSRFLAAMKVTGEETQ